MIYNECNKLLRLYNKIPSKNAPLDPKINNILKNKYVKYCDNNRNVNYRHNLKDRTWSGYLTTSHFYLQQVRHEIDSLGRNPPPLLLNQ